MKALKQNEITKSSQFYENLYHEFFSDLKNAKHLMTQYYKIREIARIQSLVVSDYKKVWCLLQKDPNFSSEELKQMSGNYQSILERSLENTDLLIYVISTFSVSMTESERIKLISDVETKVKENLKVLQHYNFHNGLISLQRAKSAVQREHLMSLYELKPLNQ